MIQEMALGESSLHLLAIPCRLLRFIVPFGCPLCKFRTILSGVTTRVQILYELLQFKLTEQAVKPVILGPPLHDKSSSRDNGITIIHVEEKNGEEGTKNIGMTLAKVADVSQAKAPKKMVSFSESIEEILPYKLRRKKMNDLENLACTQQCKRKEPKPLKSILKVGSRIYQK